MGRNKKTDPNLLIAIGVLIASFAALFVYMRQAAIMSEQTEILLQQTKANAWPYVSINTGRSFHDNEISEYRYEVSNKGTGPAIIEGVKITYKGEIARNWKELYTALEVPDTIRKGHTNEMISNRVISSGGSILLIDFSNNKKVMKWVFEKAKDIHITICYKSVFGEFWEIKREGFYTNLEATKRTSVAENTIREEERFIE